MAGAAAGRFEKNYSTSQEAIRYYYQDHLGSRVGVMDESGAVLATVTYDIWGNATATGASGYDAEGEIRFTGKPQDATGLYYFNARYYDPQSKRFLTEDPIQQGMNWYIYCGNDPVNFTDPDGMVYTVGDDDRGQVITERNYEPVSVDVTISRRHNGYGNEFDSIRTIKTITMRNGQRMDVGYSDTVGANADTNTARRHNGMTLPDGDYYLTSDGLNQNANGGYDSPSYRNVLRIQTNDQNIPESTRSNINNDMYLFHATENIRGNTWDSPNLAGCVSPQGHQAGHDAFMSQLPDVVFENIHVTIWSASCQNNRRGFFPR